MTSVGMEPRVQYRGPNNKLPSKHAVRVESYSSEDNNDDSSSSDEKSTVEYLHNAEASSTVPSTTPTSSLIQWYNRVNAKHEIPRKLFHSGSGFFSLWLYVSGHNGAMFTKGFVILGSVLLLAEFLRFRSARFNKIICKSFGFMMRDSEHDSYNGILFFLFGLIVTTALLPKDLCFMTNLFLSWGDTSASVVGREWGKHSIKLTKDKSLIGSMGSFITGLGSCYLIYAYLVPKYTHLVDLPGDISWSPETSHMNIHVYAIACGMVASISELIDLWGIDDNFTIPTLSGALLYPLLYFTRK